jgi:hypothetical protein
VKNSWRVDLARAISPTAKQTDENYRRGDTTMDRWELIFHLSKVSGGGYDGESLPAWNWLWPHDTWFQQRLRHLRQSNGRYRRGSPKEISHEIGSALAIGM